MTKPGEGYREVLGYLLLCLSIVFPCASLGLFYHRRRYHPIKRSGRPKVSFVMMYMGILISSVSPFVEAFSWSNMPCFIHLLAMVCFPPCFIAPLVVSAFCHFKESRIHAKMARHASEVDIGNRGSRDKGRFQKLVSDLKTERRNLRGFNVKSIISFLVIYGGLVTWVILSTILNENFKEMMRPGGEEDGVTGCPEIIQKMANDEGFEEDPRHFVSYLGMILFLASLIFILMIVYYTRRRGLTDDYGITREYAYTVGVGFMALGSYAGLYYWHKISPSVDSDYQMYFEKEVLDPTMVFVVAINCVYGILVLWPALRTYGGGGGRGDMIP